MTSAPVKVITATARAGQTKGVLHVEADKREREREREEVMAMAGGLPPGCPPHTGHCISTPPLGICHKELALHQPARQALSVAGRQAGYGLR